MSVFCINLLRYRASSAVQGELEPQGEGLARKPTFGERPGE
jgi:hypothetical protein